MKICFITVLYHTPEAEVARLRQQVHDLGIETFVAIDNSENRQGYAAGVNAGLRANVEPYDVFFCANPDIDITGLDKKTFLDAAEKFDIWGYAMQQDGTVYYGGEIDKWRMSGGLITAKPHERFTGVDFVSGSLFAVTKKAVQQIGYLDESYGMYYEDVEFCLRARRAGLRVGIDSQNEYLHLEESKTNAQKAGYLARNRWKFLWEHGSVSQKLYEVVRLPKTLYEDFI